MKDNIVAEEHGLQEVEDVKGLLIVVEKKQEEINDRGVVQEIVDESTAQANHTEELEVAHVEGHFPNYEDTHPSLKVSKDSVRNQVDVSTSP